MKESFKRTIIAITAIMITAFLSGCDGGSGDDSASTRSGIRITLSANPTTVNVEGNSAIYLEILDSGGNLVSQRYTVVFSTSLGTLRDPAAVITEDSVLTGTVQKSTSGGSATVLLNSDTAGTAAITAAVAGELLTVYVTYIE